MENITLKHIATENISMDNVTMENITLKSTTIANTSFEDVTMGYSQMENVTIKQSVFNNEFLLYTVQQEKAERLLPATIILFVLIITGIIGNIAFIVFIVRTSKSTPPTLLITCLAVADLGTCISAVPVVSEMRVNVAYSLVLLCKLSHLIGLWFGATACLVLWLISIDRYRKICYPLAKQLSLGTVKILVIGVTLFSLLLSLRYLVTYSLVEVVVTNQDNNKTATGYFCTANDTYKLISLVFYSLDFVLIMMMWLTVIVTYSRIIYTIVKRRLSMTNASLSIQKSRYDTKASTRKKLYKEQKTINKEVDLTRPNCNIEIDNISSSEMQTEETEIYTIENSNDAQTDKCSQKRSQKPTFEYTSVKKPSEMKLTLMMFAVSVIFILCFTPYFAIRIFIRIVLNTEREYDFSAWIQFALKLPYINSACNPIIYYIFNPKFRRYILACCRK